MILQTDEEIKNILYYLWLTKDIEGDVIEVGVYRGGSAEVMSKGKNPLKQLFLFDTFAPNDNGFDDMFDQTTTFEEVKMKLPQAVIVKGKFGKAFNSNWMPWSFAHIDVDDGQSTLEALAILYPLMSVDGVIVMHDYLNVNLKVKEVTDDFFRLKKEKPIPLTNTSQCVIIKQ